jgi:hypothetical protein
MHAATTFRTPACNDHLPTHQMLAYIEYLPGNCLYIKILQTTHLSPFVYRLPSVHKKILVWTRSLLVANAEVNISMSTVFSTSDNCGKYLFDILHVLFGNNQKNVKYLQHNISIWELNRIKKETMAE